MTGEAPHSPRAERSTRGFLFADLRGYTAFVDRHGAQRAAAMLDRYRALVRAAVADFDGAEIRTEGDSFYVVFGSASSAIACGLAIVGGAEEAAAADPATAFQVGVGIHAGETIETAEGYVGSAVNIAARICARAGPNQVLVSGTVRALTAGVVEASFVPVGRRRLKGLRDAVELFRAVAQAGAPASRRPLLGLPTSRVAAMVAAVGVVALIAVVVAFVVRPDFASSGEELGDGAASSARASVQAQSSAAQTASASASAGEVGYPNPEEEALLLLVEERYRPECERGLSRDAPGIWFRDSDSGATGPWVHEPVPYQGSITCPIGRSVGPDTVWFWHAQPATQRGITIVPVELVRNHAGRFNVFPGGDGCEATHRALEDWSFGGTAGLLLCYTSSDGTATLEWGYEGTNVLAKAVRHDGDMAELLGWWMENARFGP